MAGDVPFLVADRLTGPTARRSLLTRSIWLSARAACWRRWGAGATAAAVHAAVRRAGRNHTEATSHNIEGL